MVFLPRWRHVCDNSVSTQTDRLTLPRYSRHTNSSTGPARHGLFGVFVDRRRTKYLVWIIVLAHNTFSNKQRGPESLRAARGMPGIRLHRSELFFPPIPALREVLKASTTSYRRLPRPPDEVAPACIYLVALERARDGGEYAGTQRCEGTRTSTAHNIPVLRCAPPPHRSTTLFFWPWSDRF